MTTCMADGCENEVISIPGRRPKLYCSPGCRQKEWLKKNAAKPKQDYDALDQLLDWRKEVDAWCEKRGWKAEELIEKFEGLERQPKHGFHDITCSADPAKPMGCEGCSCAMYKRAKQAEKERDELMPDALSWRQRMNQTTAALNNQPPSTLATTQNKPNTAPQIEKRIQDEPDFKKGKQKAENCVGNATRKDIENLIEVFDANPPDKMPEGLSEVQQAVWRNNHKMKNKKPVVTQFGSSKKDKE